MHKEAREELMVRAKLAVIEYADHFGVTEACREFNIPRASFYRWKHKYQKAGRSGLYRERPIAYCHPRRTSSEVKVERFHRTDQTDRFTFEKIGFPWQHEVFIHVNHLGSCDF